MKDKTILCLALLAAALICVVTGFEGWAIFFAVLLVLA
jgi:hypothetical protein